jgi:TolB-like protein/Tfp pilus assembly protein PilF
MRIVSLVLIAATFLARPVFPQCADGSPPPCRARVAVAPVSPTSIAVLYFDNLSRDTADTYLADGFTEEVMSRLGQVERLQVKSRTTVQRLRGRPLEDPVAVGRSLGVAHLVSGSVMRSAGRVRVTVELTRVANGNSVWGRSFDRATADLIQTEAEIAESVAVNVGARLAPAERRRIEERQTRNAEAYDRYLRARFEMSRRTKEGFFNSIRWYEAAVAADPNMAAAWIGIATAYSQLGGIYYGPEIGIPRDSLNVLGRIAAERAIRIDSTSVEALMARAVQADPSHHAATYARIVQLRPRDAGAHHNLALSLRILGHDEQAISEFRRAIELEPDRAISLMNLGQTYGMKHRFALAKPWIDSAVSLHPEASFFYTEQAFIALAMGDTATARRAGDNVGSHGNPRGREEILAMLEARAGDTASARRRVASVDSALAGRDCWVSHDCLELAMALASVGSRERALDVLERITPHDGWLAYWMTAPRFDPISQEPRYQRLLQESRTAASLSTRTPL